MNGQIDLGAITPSKYFFSIAVILGLLFAMITPADNHPKWVVYLQWQLQTVLPMTFMVVVHSLLCFWPRFNYLGSWTKLLISGFGGVCLFSPIALMIDIWIGSEPQYDDLITATVSEWTQVAPPILLCWLAINAPWIFGYRLQKEVSPVKTIDQESKSQTTIVNSDTTHTEQDLASSPIISCPHFLSLVPTKHRGSIIYLKAELHYLQVVTEQGSSLILYNLRDAVNELDSEAGIQVHRSYWVKNTQVEGFNRKGRQGELQMKGGYVVPVSRAKLAQVAKQFSA